MCVLSIKVPIRKKSVNLFNDPRIYIYIYIYIYIHISCRFQPNSLAFANWVCSVPRLFGISIVLNDNIESRSVYPKSFSASWLGLNSNME